MQKISFFVDFIDPILCTFQGMCPLVAPICFLGQQMGLMWLIETAAVIKRKLYKERDCINFIAITFSAPAKPNCVL